MTNIAYNGKMILTIMLNKKYVPYTYLDTKVHIWQMLNNNEIPSILMIRF